MDERPVIGVDIDGVLGNQVAGVLDRVRPQGVELAYEDVIHWDVPLGDSSFVPEIAKAMEDEEYVLQMPVHKGAAAMLDELRRHCTVKLITVRPEPAVARTMQWLAANGLAYDELVTAQEARKSLHEVDALVDDYAGNIADFLENVDGPAVLVDQPWNQDEQPLQRWKGDRRLVRVRALSEVPDVIARWFSPS